MKKYLRFICISVVLAMLVGTNGFAVNAESGESLLLVDWYGDYTNSGAPEIKIDVESSAGYIQTVAVVMYDDDFDFESDDRRPAFTDYYRMDEVVVKKGEKATVTFNITNSGTPLEDGAYHILVQGSGNKSDESKVQIPVWVINPSKISGIIGDFNDATTSNLLGYINEVKKPLKLEVKDSESTDRLKAFISIREKDYSDSFANLHDIEKAWKISGIIDCLANNSSDKAALQSLFEENSEKLGIDTSSDDYKDNTAEVYSNIVYNYGIDGASSVSEIKKLFDESVAIAAINKATGKTISQKLAEYYDEVGISEKNYDKLADCTDNQVKLKVERLFLNKNFRTVSKIKETFDDAVEKYLDDDSSSSDDSGSGGGGGGGGSSAIKGGGGVPVVSTVTTPVTSQTSSFEDCTPEHWAHSHVEELKKINIVSGYADGNFYPDKTVKREEFVKMIVLLAGLNDEGSVCDFKDVEKSEWYYTYVASAYKEGIVTGINADTFGIGADISRQDVAVIVYRLLGKHGVKVSDGLDSKVFADADKIADYASESVGALTQMSVLNGFEDGTFRPEASLTRAEAAKIINLVKTYIKQ